MDGGTAHSASCSPVNPAHLRRSRARCQARKPSRIGRSSPVRGPAGNDTSGAVQVMPHSHSGTYAAGAPVCGPTDPHGRRLGTGAPDLVRAAGGEPVAARPGERSIETTWPDLAAAAPDIIIVAPCGYHLDGAAGQAPQRRPEIPRCPGVGHRRRRHRRAPRSPPGRRRRSHRGDPAPARRTNPTRWCHHPSGLTVTGRASPPPQRAPPTRRYDPCHAHVARRQNGHGYPAATARWTSSPVGGRKNRCSEPAGMAAGVTLTASGSAVGSGLAGADSRSEPPLSWVRPMTAADHERMDREPGVWV